MLRGTLGTTTGRGRVMFLAGLLLLGAGIAWHYPLVAALGGCFVLLVTAEVVSIAVADRIDAARSIDPTVVVRQERCTGRLVVHGHRRRGLVRLDVSDRVDGALVPIALPDRTTPEDDAQIVYAIPTPRRGLVDVGPVQVRLTGLTGMAARSSEAGSVDQVRVLPRRVPLTGMMRGHRRAVDGIGASPEFGGTDLTGLHDYVPGDDLRRLHWATSARTGTLMVREDAEPSEPHLCVILDDRAASYLGDIDLFEEAVEIAAAICRAGTTSGGPVRLTTASGRHSVHVPGSVVVRARREQQELEWLFADIDLTAAGRPVEATPRDADIAVAVTGPGADPRELGLALGTAPTRVLAISDPAPLVSANQEAGLLVLRGQTSGALAMLWDQAVAS